MTGDENKDKKMDKSKWVTNLDSAPMGSATNALKLAKLIRADEELWNIYLKLGIDDWIPPEVQVKVRTVIATANNISSQTLSTEAAAAAALVRDLVEGRIQSLESEDAYQILTKRPRLTDDLNLGGDA